VMVSLKELIERQKAAREQQQNQSRAAIAPAARPADSPSSSAPKPEGNPLAALKSRVATSQEDAILTQAQEGTSTGSDAARARIEVPSLQPKRTSFAELMAKAKSANLVEANRELAVEPEEPAVEAASIAEIEVP